MKGQIRKLFLVIEDDTDLNFSSDSPYELSSNTLPSLIKRQIPHSSLSNESSSYGGRYNAYGISPSFDSSIALTFIILITALIFMGFFSIYTRRFPCISPFRQAAGSASAKGAEPETVNSLPVHIYDVGCAKQGCVGELECAICLSEFEQGELLKAIPFCGHVFHVGCIDTWLALHVTCPLCRTTKLFPEKVAAVGEIGGIVGRDTWNMESGGSGFVGWAL